MCHANYTSVIKIESMKSELTELFKKSGIEVPEGFDELRHTVQGGTAGSLTDNQEKVIEMLEEVPLEYRQGLLSFYERDFQLFNYNFDPKTMKIS